MVSDEACSIGGPSSGQSGARNMLDSEHVRTPKEIKNGKKQRAEGERYELSVEV